MLTLPDLMVNRDLALLCSVVKISGYAHVQLCVHITLVLTTRCQRN